MDKSSLPLGVGEIARNCRLVLALAMSLTLFVAFLLVGGYGTLHATWPLKSALAALMIGVFAGIAVLLKQPFGEERMQNLEASVHRGLNLFYGAELGGFAVGFILTCGALLFGDSGAVSSVVIR